MEYSKKLLCLFTLIIFNVNISSLGAQNEDPIRCQLEHWLDYKMQDPAFAEEFRLTEAYLKTKGVNRNPDCSDPVILPVAIHWNGDIEDVPCLLDMAENQIQVLNEDFGAYNADITNYCDDAWNCSDDYALGAISGGTCIQFCLATFDHPAGSGIAEGDPAFTFGQYDFDSEAPAWDGYVNIFVSNISPDGYGNNLLGLAPVGGGSNPDGNGVFVSARAFGGYEEECVAGPVVINDADNYDLGRTTTHELGHYFGLWHVFAGCGNGDGIDDTPAQSTPNYGTPSVFSDCSSNAENTCNTQDFFFNYMDYTHDVSMYMFTSDQSDVLYDVATDGSYKSGTSICENPPDNYFPTYPGGCYSCPDLTVESSILNVNCFGDCNGAIFIDNVLDAEEPISYAWSTGESTASIEDLCPGEYSVTINDNLDCEVIESFIIEEPDELLPNATATDESGNDFNDGSASANPGGGTGPYSYAWSNGENLQTITGLPPGPYTVSITDANDCQATEVVFVSEFNCPDLSLVYYQENPDCFGDCNGVLEITEVLQAVEPIEYNWSNGVITAFNNGLCMGTYNVSITDAVNCSIVSPNFIISSPTAIEAELSTTDETAFEAEDGTASVSVTGGEAPYTFSWSNGDSDQNLFNLPPGTYTVTITDQNSCSVELTDSVLAYTCPPLLIDANSEDVSCFGSCDGVIFLQEIENATPPISVIWSNGETGDFQQDLCPGTYSLSITDANDCQADSSFYIDQPELLSVNEMLTHESFFNANDGTINIEITGGTFPYNILWSTGSSSANLENLAPGEYEVTVTDSEDCSFIASYMIDDFECPEFSLISEQVGISCYGECDAYIEISAILNAVEPLSYSWNNGGDTSLITELCAGIYELTITDAFNCSLIDSFSIENFEVLMADIIGVNESAMDANDGSANCLPQGGTLPYSYLWSTGDTTQMISELAPGEYSVILSDAQGCMAFDTVMIAEYECLELEIIAEVNHSICYGDCSGSIQFTEVINGEAPFEYAWNTGSMEGSLDTLCPGEYSLSLTDSRGCTATQNYLIEEAGEIIIEVDTLIDVRSNQPGAILISSNGDYEYEWWGPYGFKSAEQDITGLEAGCYELRVTDPQNGCSRDTLLCLDDLTIIRKTPLDGIQIYPNPFNRTLTIDFSLSRVEEAQIKLMDPLGKNLKEFTKDAFENKVLINPGQLPSGTYWIRINDGEHELIKKVVYDPD